MKKIALLFSLVLAAGLTFAGTMDHGKDPVVEVSIKGGKVTLINDTDSKVSVHTGSGSVSLNPNGGKTSFSCDTGKSVKVDGKVIFKNNSDFCGETVKISDFL